MTDPIEHNARAAAHRLAAEYPGLPAKVEAALYARGLTQRPERYLDPISLGALIVSVASLAWTVYTDLRKKTPMPSPDVVFRTVRVQLRDADDLASAQRERIIGIVVDETIQAATDTDTRGGQLR
jgi:hypothetical protein